MYDFIINSELTHALIIYSDIKYVKELQNIIAENNKVIKLYPFKWVTNLNDKNLDKEAVGVKFHHVRGGVIDYDSREFKNYLKTLKNHNK
jgi:hypothetical protein